MLALEVPDLLLHALRVPAVGIAREVRCRNDAEPAHFLHGVDFGFAKQIGAVAHVVGAPGGARRVLRPPGSGMVAALLANARLASRIAFVPQAGRGGSRSAHRTRWRRLARVLRIAGKRVARHQFGSSSPAGSGMSTWPTWNCLSRCESLRPVFLRRNRRLTASARPNRFAKRTTPKPRIQAPYAWNTAEHSQASVFPRGVGLSLESVVFRRAGGPRGEKEALVRSAGSSSGRNRRVGMWPVRGRKLLQQNGAGAPRLGRRSPASARSLFGVDRNPGSHLNASSSRK